MNLLIPTTSKKRNRIIGIYGLYCSTTKMWYVGASTDVLRRVHNHLYEMSDVPLSMTKLCVAGREHGVNKFTPILLEETQDVSRLRLLELEWQTKLNSKDNGYNSQASGDSRFWEEEN